MARSSEATEANFGFDVDEADRFTLGGILKLMKHVRTVLGGKLHHQI